MRINVNNYRVIVNRNGLTDADVCKSTGLSEKTLNWILDNGFIEVSTLERIADAIGSSTKEIALPDYDGCIENVIEWTKDNERATLTLCQRRTITKVKKLAESHPEECQIVAENKDGSISAHVPVSWVKISPPKKLTEKQLEQVKQNISKFNSARNNLD